jgi:hypothetical protein
MRRRVIPLGVCTELISELNARVAFLLVGQSKVSPGRVLKWSLFSNPALLPL